MNGTVAEQVRKRRDIDQIRTARRARHFSGLETLMMGLKLSALALRIAGSD
jgi:hypothetical protein